MTRFVSIWVRIEVAASRLLVRDSGQALVEYALILALLMIIVLTATRFLGTKITSALSTVANSV